MATVVITAVMAEAILVATVVITAVMAEATAAVTILNLIVLTQINPQVQKVGKIEVMGTLLRILNMKVAEVGERGESQMEVMLQMMKISNPFL